MVLPEGSGQSAYPSLLHFAAYPQSLRSRSGQSAYPSLLHSIDDKPLIYKGFIVFSSQKTMHFIKIGQIDRAIYWVVAWLFHEK